jgi:hypothetical protein
LDQSTLKRAFNRNYSKIAGNEQESDRLGYLDYLIFEGGVKPADIYKFRALASLIQAVIFVLMF